MAQPFDTHSYPVVPATDGTNTGAQFGSASEQSQDYNSQPSFTTMNTSGLSGQSAYSGEAGLGQSSTGRSTSTSSSAAQQAMQNPGQTAANVTNKIVDRMLEAPMPLDHKLIFYSSVRTGLQCCGQSPSRSKHRQW